MRSEQDGSTPLVVRQDDPFNAETALEHLTERFVTPVGRFFVRSHASVPRVDARSFRVSVGGMVGSALSLSLDDLTRGFRQRVVTATVECAGNRRQDLLAVRPIPGELAWDAGAIGTAEWKGVALGDVLAEAGVAPGARHVAMTGLDRVRVPGGETPFGGSIPIGKASGGEVLLAHEMNGGPLDAVHGFPLRAVVPGYIGARSIKWLHDIVVQDAPSANHFYASAYRLVPANGSAPATALGEIALNAVICRPRSREARSGDRVRVQGYAIGAGGQPVERVEVSADGGRTWREAELGRRGEAWAWRFWSLDIQTSPADRELVVRAWDATGIPQPPEPAATWNVHGYANNAWHRVALTALATRA